MQNTLHHGLERYLLPEELEKLRAAKVGIAGVGGLGSNVALLLARCGVENMLLVDDDTVEASNLNRQCFFPRHVGSPKVEALQDILLELNPHMQVHCQNMRITPTSVKSLLNEAPLWVEALDQPQDKRLFVESALMAQKFTVSASGIAGYSGPPMQKRSMGKYLVMVGDFSSDIDNFPPLAPRVMQAAAMQADAMLAHILGGSCT